MLPAQDLISLPENDSGSPTELRMLTLREGSHDEWAEGPLGLGNIKKQPTKSASYQPSFIGPDLRRHSAPIIFPAKMNAERWLSKERDYKERCEAAGETWKPPAERRLEKKAEVLPLSKYGKTVMDQRILRPRTRIEYESKWSQLIEPKLGWIAVRDLTTTAVRAWFAGLDSSKPTRNRHAYAILNMICNTAVKDGFFRTQSMSNRRRDESAAEKKVKIPTTVELHTVADKLGADERTSRFKALVLLAGWCGM